jgi:RNA polymerase sigma factor (sigma-70 family)
MKERLDGKVLNTDATALIQALRMGDHRMLEEMYVRYYPQTEKFVLANRGTTEAARDVFQEAVLVLYRNAMKSDFELRCKVETYLYAVVRRLWLKELRIQGRTSLYREEREEDWNVEEDMHTHAEKETQYDRIEQSMQVLGEPCAGLLRMFYAEKLGMEVIAERFGYAGSDHAKTQKYKCLQRLKRIYFNKVEEKYDIDGLV